MNFDLSEDQRLLQHSVARFLESECPPPRLREIFDGPDPHDEKLWKGMAALGLGGLHLPEACGGGGLELLDLAVVAEVLGRFAAPGPFLGHALAGLALELGGSDAQRRAWLPRLALGEALATVAFAEAGEAWDPGAWTLAPGPVLRGEKRFVPAAEVADLIVVGVRGGGLALVEGRGPGVSAQSVDGIDRTRRVARLRLEGAACEPLPGGAEAAPRVRDAGLVLLAADAFGGASRCVELAVEYAKTREQFGVTIGHFQALKHQLADLAVDVEPARALYWYAAHAFDHLPAERELSAALAKAHLAERFVHVARKTVEAHGGIGYTWECDVQFWLKRAIFDRAFLGDPASHRARVADLLW